MDTQGNKLLEIYVNEEKQIIITLRIKMDLYAVTKINLKTKKMREYYFDNKNQALKRYEKMVGKNKNVEM